jgi:type IV pilus assembly protein PilV
MRNPAFKVNKGTATANRRQRGVSMVELLVAIVIFAFSMLGLAGLQTRTLWFGVSSLQRSQATALADDIFDRMRADAKNARAGAWDTGLNDSSSSISGTAISKKDLKDWKQEVEALPEGKASISTNSGVVTVVIQWNDSRGRDDDALQFKTMSRL